MVWLLSAAGAGGAVESGVPPTSIDGTRQGTDLSVSWDDRSGPGPWYTYTVPGKGTGIGWLGDHGVDGSGFVWCDLSPQVAWPKGVWAFFPLFTYGWTEFEGAESVDLLRTPLVSVTVNATPLAHLGTAESAPANLRGGELRFWIAEWNSKTNHAVYSYRRAVFEVGGTGWVRLSVTLRPDPDAWEVHALAGQPSALSEILAHPQQWGLAVIGARTGEQPSGYLGFDDLRVTRRWRSETWGRAGAGRGWQVGAQPVEEVASGGAGGSGDGFVRAALERSGSGTAGAVGYPFWTRGDAANGAGHPVNLQGNNEVRLRLATGLPTGGGLEAAAPADLRGGQLRFFVGRWHDAEHHAYYCFRPSDLSPGLGAWRTQRLVLSSAPEDWELYAAGTQGGPPLDQVLADPGQWGIALFGASGRASGCLDIDDLSVAAWTETWDRASAVAGWDVLTGVSVAGPGASGTESVQWRGFPGSTPGGFVLCDLRRLLPGVTERKDVLFPLATTSSRHWVDLVEKPRLRLRVSPTPTSEGGSADFGGGALTVFVGHWEGANRFACYLHRQPLAVPVGGGWATTGFDLSPDPADWDVLDSPPDPTAVGESARCGRELFGLTDLLRNPTHWGLAIVGATGATAGWLGVDDWRWEPVDATPVDARWTRVAGGLGISWSGWLGVTVELGVADRLRDGTDWSVQQVWDDGFFARPTALGVREAFSRRGAGPGFGSGRFQTLPGPVKAAFYRLMFERTPVAD